MKFLLPTLVILILTSCSGQKNKPIETKEPKVYTDADIVTSSLIGNYGIGVLRKEGDSIINFSRENNLIHPTSTLSGDKSPPGTLEHVFTISEVSRGNIWFGDRDTGVWRYHGKTVTNYTIDKNLNSQMVLNIYEDQNKHLLFGMADGGVYTFNGTSFDRHF